MAEQWERWRRQGSIEWARASQQEGAREAMMEADDDYAGDYWEDNDCCPCCGGFILSGDVEVHEVGCAAACDCDTCDLGPACACTCHDACSDDGEED